MSLSSLWIRTLSGYTRADQITHVGVTRRSNFSATSQRPPRTGDYIVELGLPATAGNEETGFSSDTRVFAAHLTHTEAVDLADQLVTDLIELPKSKAEVSILACTGGNVEHFRSPGEYRSKNADS